MATNNFLAGNPIIITISTGLNLSTRYRIYSGAGYSVLLFEGSVYSAMGTVNVDISDLFMSLSTKAGVTPAKMVTVSDTGVEYVGTNTGNLYLFNVYGGGISNGMMRKLSYLEKDIFSSKLKKSDTNFLLTTRTNESVIYVSEDELLPFYYYAKGLKFYIKADGATVATYDHSSDTEESLQRIDFAALREQLVGSKNKLFSVFEIVTDTASSCTIVITEAEKQNSYFLRFINSWGCWEKISLGADIDFNPTFSDITIINKYDKVVNGHVARNMRKQVLNSNIAGAGYKTEAERLFIIDMMLSDSVILITPGSEYEVNVTGELPSLVSTQGTPVNVSIKIDLIDKEKYFSNLGTGAPIPVFEEEQPLYEYRWIYHSSSCLLSSGLNTGVLRTINKKQVRILPSLVWNDVYPAEFNEVDTVDEAACPIQTTRWVESKACILDNNMKNTGQQEIVKVEQRLIPETLTWENTGRTTYSVVTNYVDCPLPPQLPCEIRIAVGPTTTYNPYNQKIYPYIENTTIQLDFPTLNGYNYAFIQIPQNKSMIVRNSMNVDVTDQWGVVGIADLPGYQINKIYCISNVFSTSRSARFYITVF